LLPVLTLFIGATSAVEGVGYNIERVGDEREWWVGKGSSRRE